MRYNKWLSLILLMSVALIFAACGEDQGPTAPSVSEFEILQSKLDAYVGGTAPPVITAQAVFDNMNDGDPTNDYFILSVRKPEHYAVGHIPGAVNIFWKELGEASKLAVLPKDRKIVVYCYTGHTGGIATTVLNALGYDAVNLKFGMMAWTKDANVRAVSAFREGVDSHDFPIETKLNTAEATHSLPDPDYTTSDKEDDILLAAVKAYVAGTKPPVITAQALFDNLNDGDTSNDPVILSVRKAEHYALGHVPGAINIYWRDLCKTENLKKLPTDRQIVVYCYTGHTGAVATTALNLLGYDAVNMKFGIMAWTTDATVRAVAPFSEDTAHDFTIETGS